MLLSTGYAELNIQTTMKNIFTLFIAAAMMAIHSCGNKQELSGVSADLAMTESAPAIHESPQRVEPAVERKIIKEGEIRFESADINATKTLITKTVQELGGYISKDNVNDYTNKLEHHLVIRVPSDKFDLLLKKISDSADKIDSKNVDVLDVTAEYIDVDSRIKTKKELEARYKELLKQATKVEEILTIEKEIGQLRTEIESVEGQMKYLKDRISYSTLNVTYYQKTDSAFRFTSKLGQAFNSGWDYFLWFIVGIAQFWMFILIAGLTLFFILKRERKTKNSGK